MSVDKERSTERAKWRWTQSLSMNRRVKKRTGTRIMLSSSLPGLTRTHTTRRFTDETPVTGCTWRLTCGPPLPTQDSRNVNASIRALNSSPTLKSTAASTISDVLAHAADLTGLMATVRETHPTQQQQKNEIQTKKPQTPCAQKIKNQPIEIFEHRSCAIRGVTQTTWIHPLS